MTRSIVSTLLTVIWLLLSLQRVQGQYSIDLSVSSCSETFYYDTTSYSCEPCPDNSIQGSTGEECVCNAGFFEEFDTRFDFFKACSICPSGTAPNQDNSTCLECVSPATLVNGYCLCPEGYRTTDRALNGTDLGFITCQLCPDNAYQGPNDTSIWECTPCPHYAMIYDTSSTPWKCVCPEGFRASGEICVSQEDVDALPVLFKVEFARVVDFYNVQAANGEVTQEQINSDTFQYLYYQAALGCQEEQDPAACQTLGNLCVLQLYNEQSSACQLFQSIVSSKEASNAEFSDENWAEGMPWLYYTDPASSILADSNKIDLQVAYSSDAGASSLTFQLARYTVNGTFLGFQSLSTELSICPMGYKDVLNMLKFGAITDNQCDYHLNNLLDRERIPEIANDFFDLYVQASDGSLIDVPVLVTNLRDADGLTPNTLESSSWRLTRRFFMYDTISGIEEVNGFTNLSTPSIVRWASDVKLKTMLDPDVSSNIYIPYLEITYSEKETTVIHTDTTTPVSFQMIYSKDHERFWRGILIGFIIFQVIIIIRVILDMVFFTQNNPPSLLSTPRFIKQFLYKISLSIMDWWSEISFWFVFFVSMYWFLAYKASSNASVLLPPYDEWRTTYVAFYVVFALITVFKFMVCVLKIIEQSTVDLFFIDWETPKLYLDNKVPVWRSIFLANEYNELQSEMRYLYPETLLIWAAFFIKGMGWEYFSKADPDMNRETDSLEPLNLVLFFFLSAVTFLVIAAVLYCLQLINAGCFSNKYQEFMDLCSVSNISLIIMDSFLHGYYIHGEAPWVSSDAVISVLKKNLDGEGQGQGLKRGISDKYPNHQSYEIYIPLAFREEITKIYESQISKHKLQEINQEQEKAKNLQFALQKKEVKAGPPDEKSKLFENAIQHKLNFTSNDFKRSKLGDQFKKLINNTKLNDKMMIVEKGCCERFLGMVPSAVNLSSLKEAGLLVKDYFTKWPSFARVLYCNLDYQILLLNILIFNGIFAIWKNSMAALFVVYAVEKFLIKLRFYVGQRNIAKKTLIDKCFLI